MQPYACVVVRDQADREKLADSMLATNGRKVKEAPVVVVFAADLGIGAPVEWGSVLVTLIGLYRC